jgi:gliding motility-associated-like protein
MDAIPSVNWNFDYWELNHTVNPSIQATTVNFGLTGPDTIIAHFTQNDSARIQYRVMPPGSGNIVLNGTTLPFYPYNDNVAPGEVYNLAAVPGTNFVFDHWEANHHLLNPSMTDSAGTLTVIQQDTVIAYFVAIPPVIEPEPEAPTMYIPNSFTPNGDGLNEYFSLHFNDRVTDVEIHIFDRWGYELFSASTLSFQWDGTYASAPAPMGVYVYRVNYRNDDNTDHQLIGHINLIR